jgi:biotin operon repressor
MNTERRIRFARVGVAEQGDGAGGGLGGAPGARERGKSAEVILLPKQLRMEWTDVIMLDRRLTFAQKVVAGALGYFLNRHRGDTFVSPDTLAALLDMNERSVRRALGQLEELGFLIVQRATRGGRGLPNTYAPALDRMQVSATARGQNLVDRCEALVAKRGAPESTFPGEKGDSRVHLSDEKGGHQSPPFDPERWTLESRKVDSGVPLTLKHPSDANPSRARGAGEAVLLAPGFAALPAAAERLLARLGRQDFASWFGQARIEAIDDDLLTISLQSSFYRDHVAARFGEAIVECCRGAGLSIRRVEIGVRK